MRPKIRVSNVARKKGDVAVRLFNDARDRVRPKCPISRRCGGARSQVDVRRPLTSCRERASCRLSRARVLARPRDRRRSALARWLVK